MLNRVFFLNILNIAILMLAQVFVFNNMHFFHQYIPIIYIFWIIFYPYENSDGLLFLVLSFLLGVSVDLLMDTGGVNAFASVLIAQIKNPLIRYFSGLQREMKIFHFSDFSFIQFVSYVVVMVIIHHSALFLLDGFKISNLLVSLEEVLITAGFSFLFIIIIYVFFKNMIH